MGLFWPLGVMSNKSPHCQWRGRGEVCEVTLASPRVSAQWVRAPTRGLSEGRYSLSIQMYSQNQMKENLGTPCATGSSVRTSATPW